MRRFPKSVVGVVGLVSGLALGAAATMVSGQTGEAALQSNTTDASSRGVSEPVPEAAYDPEFCEVLEGWNADKKISDAKTRDRFSGEYGRADDVDRRQTWRVETACGNFLVAVPLWDDVSPPVLARKGENSFEDSMRATWEFQVGGDGTVTGVVMVSADGSVSEMTRIGAEKHHWGDPHEKLNGKHLKDWKGKQK